MTQEQKDLLLKDLCARLPYGVKGEVSKCDCNNRECEFVATIDGKLYDRFAVAQELWFDNVTIKPYLFPISSMTEEQHDQLYIDSRVKNDSVDILDALANDMDAIEYLLKNNFDIHGLIPMGLAEDATGKNIY